MKRIRLFDFDTNFVTVYFKKSTVLGIKGLVPNLRSMKRSTFPLYARLSFYYLEFIGNKVTIYSAKAINSSKDVSNYDMFIAGQPIKQVEDSKHKFLVVDRSEVDIAMHYVYKYEFIDYAYYLSTHKFNEHDATNVKKEKHPRFVKASVKVDGIIRDFLYTSSIINEEVPNGYKYYVMVKHGYEYPTHMIIDDRFSSRAIGTVLSPDPIMTDFNGICYLDWRSDFEVATRAYPYNRVDSYLTSNKIGEKGMDEMLDYVAKVNEQLGDKADLDTLFAVTMKNTINRGFAGFIGKDMKFVYIDNYGRCFNKDGFVENTDGKVMMFLLDKDGCMQNMIVKEDLSDDRYEAAMKHAKNRFPNR